MPTGMGEMRFVPVLSWPASKDNSTNPSDGVEDLTMVRQNHNHTGSQGGTPPFQGEASLLLPSLLPRKVGIMGIARNC